MRHLAGQHGLIFIICFHQVTRRSRLGSSRCVVEIQQNMPFACGSQ